MKDGNEIIRLKKIGLADFRFLYQLLAERDSIANISHKKMPMYHEHVKFVKSKPYRKWCIIYFKNRRVGSVYLSRQDEIGIFLKKGVQGKGIGSMALRLFMKESTRDRFLANISPRNKESAKFFKKNGFTLIQHTYEFMKK